MVRTSKPCKLLYSCDRRLPAPTEQDHAANSAQYRNGGNSGNSSDPMMTECCDVVVAHSPPALFTSGSQPELSAVFYQNLRLVIPHAQQSPLAARRCNPRASPNSPKTPEDGGGGESSKACRPEPRRPCLVTRIDSDGSIGSSSSSSSSSSSDENEPASPTRRKKKVVFADDRGLSLTQVRLMNEPSNQPPKLMSVGPYLQQNLQSAAGQSPAPDSQHGRWRLLFSQPASNYVDFRRRLDTGNVSLENVIVRSSDRRIVGTVKVRNVSYDKLVFVRCSDNLWNTYRDTVCTYVRNNGVTNGASHGSAGGAGAGDKGSAPSGGASGPSFVCNGVTAIYDTFSFRLPLPADSTSVQFAVCYKTDDFECWDNNSGQNYCLSVDGADGGPRPQPVSAQCSPQLPSGSPASSDFDSPTVQAPTQSPPTPVHYFGSHSRQNSWNPWRDDSSAYW